MTQQYQERYARQEIIKGWVQKKLTDARVVVLGHDALSEFVNLGLTALGIGEIRVVTNAKNGKQENIISRFKDYTNYNGNEKAKIFSYVLRKINPSVNVIDIHTKLFNNNYTVVFNNPKVVIDVTNDKDSKVLCAEYCKEHKMDFISAIAGPAYGIVDVNPDSQKLKEHFVLEKEKQDLIVSQILAGFVIDEVRKILLPLNANEKLCKKTLRYNLTGTERF